MSEIKLLPCPFCGGEAEVRATKRPVFNGKYMGTAHYVVGCIDTKCIGRIQRRYNSIEEAIDAWNTRKPMERIVEQLEKERSIYNVLDWNVAINKAIKIVKGGAE